MHKLSDLDFSEVYVAVAGDAAYLTGVRGSRSASPIPATCAADLHVLWHHMSEVSAAAPNPQDFALTHDGIRYRVSAIKTTRGAWWCARRLGNAILTLQQLGFPDAVIRELMALGRRQRGLILFSGSFGDGKTSSAGALLTGFLATYGGVGLTIEDPPELPLDGAHGPEGICFQTEVSLDAQNEADFAKSLVQAKRHSPRYILLGEIRTPDAGSQALRASMMGRVILSTIHAGNVLETLQSLLKICLALDGPMAAEVMAQGLAAIIHQRLEADLNGKRRLKLEFLFFGESNSDPARNLVRQGAIAQLATIIEGQRRRATQGLSILEDRNGSTSSPRPRALIG